MEATCLHLDELLTKSSTDPEHIALLKDELISLDQQIAICRMREKVAIIITEETGAIFLNYTLGFWEVDQIYIWRLTAKAP